MSRGGIALKKFEPKKPEKEVISLRLDSRMLEEINSWAIEIDIYEPAKKEAGIKIQEETPEDSAIKAVAMMADAKVF